MALQMDLTDRVVLVTGGHRGVGAGITAAFREAGATVVTCGRSSVDQGDHRVCDVRDADACEELVQGIVESYGRLDVVVNNAGGAPYALAADASPRFHDKILGLNLAAPLALMQAAHRAMGLSGGAIVNISSVSALRPSPGTAAYGAAKAGLDSLTTTLAVEWGPAVRVNSIDVGLVRTDQTDLHYGGEAGVAAIEATIPMRRLATPADVGHLAVFLASPLAAYITGARIECHGGGEPPLFLHVVQNLGEHP